MVLNAASALEGAFEAGHRAIRTLATLPADDNRIETARAFGVLTATKWWEQLDAQASRRESVRPFLQPFPMAKLSEPLLGMARKLAATVAVMDIESAAHVIGRIYTEMLPTAFRSSYGVFYTPPKLTGRLIDLAARAGTEWATARVLDPACGGGAFLSPVARRIVQALPDCSPRILLRNISMRLHGYEIDPFAAWLSQVALDAVLLPISRQAGERLSPVVTVCDSLEQLPEVPEYDLVIGNPPYGRTRLSPSDRKRFSRCLYGHANLYGLFTDVALRHAKPGAVVAYVTPTSFLAGQYFKNLRNLIARNAPPIAIDLVDARKGVFEGVLQETLLATYSVGSAARPIDLHIIGTTSGPTLAITRTGSAELPGDPSEPWLLPRNPEDVALIRRLIGMPHRLTDWGYEVSTGPLVWNRHKEQLVNRSGLRRYPLIWAEAINPGTRFVHRANKKNHAPFFQSCPGDEWLLTDQPCVLLQRTTAKEQSRRLIASYLPESFLEEVGGVVVVENHINMLKKRPVAISAVSGPTLTAFLNSAIVDRVFRCVSGSVAVSAFELESLPLPAPSKLQELDRLVKKAASKASIEAECARLYANNDEFMAAIRHPKKHRRSASAHFS